MAEPSNGNTTPEHYEETRDARNPPNSVLHPEVRRRARWSFLIPILILAIIAGLSWLYWHGQPAHDREAQRTEDQNTLVGTSGKETPGGHNALPSFGSTQDEIKFRGELGATDRGETKK
jgi:hypothetical protein